MTAALVYAAGFCIVAVLVYMGRYSGRLRVTQTRVIDAPRARVQPLVSDPRRWRDWSPWPVDGPEIETVRGRDADRIEQRMRSTRPFPFHGRASWQFTDLQGKTQVTWSLRGRVAFSMRAFAGTVQGSIALDFRHGLDRLAGLVEPADSPRYALSYEGVREIVSFRYAYIVHEGPIEGLGDASERIVGELRARLAAQGVLVEEAAVGVYVKTDIKRRTSVCRFGLPIGAAEVVGLDMATLPAHRAYTARLQGSRAQLEVAWYLLMQRLGSEGLQPDLRVAPFERYFASASASAGHGNDTLTELHIAIR